MIDLEALEKDIFLRRHLPDEQWHQVLAVIEELRAIRASAASAERAIACAADLLNTWCRDNGVDEVTNPYTEFSLRNGIDRMWARVSGQRASAEREAEELKKDWDSVKLECERLRAEKASAKRLRRAAEQLVAILLAESKGMLTEEESEKLEALRAAIGEKEAP